MLVLKTITQTFDVKENNPPDLDFSCVPNFENLKIRCTPTVKDVDAGDSISSYDWTMGDGSFNQSSTTFDHTYADPGSYEVQLVVTDSYGKSSTLKKTYAILNLSIPEAQFEFEEGHTFSAEEDVSITIPVTGGEGLTLGMVEIKIGDAVLPGTYFSIDPLTHAISLNIPSNTFLNVGPNTISVSITDWNGITTVQSISYNVADTVAPQVAFSPVANSRFSSPNGTITLSVSDKVGINWATMSLQLDGESLNTELYERKGNLLILNVSSGMLLGPEDNKFIFKVSDFSGNEAIVPFTYYFDFSDLSFDFIPDSSTKFERADDFVTVYPVSKSAKPLNWESLKVYWNNIQINAPEISNTEGKVTLPLGLDPSGHGLLRVEMNDFEGRTVSGESLYSLKDVDPPVVEYKFPSDSTFRNTLSPDIRAEIHDASDIDPSSLIVLLNGVELTTSQYSFNSTTDIFTLKSTSSGLVKVGSNLIKLSVSDVEGNSASSEAAFQIEDNTGPSVAFTPVPGSSFLTNFNTVTLKISDMSGINWQSLRTSLNGVPMPLIYSQIAADTVILSFNPDFSFELGENTIDVSVSDVLGLSSHYAATYYLLEKRPPPISYTPDRGSLIRSFPYPISFKFTSPEQVNWDSVSIRLNDAAFLDWSKIGGDTIQVALNAASTLKQGPNVFSISFKSTDNITTNDVVTYILDDLLAPSLTLDLVGGQVFDVQKLVVPFSAQDAGGINWSSLVFTQNGAEITKDRYTQIGSNGKLNLTLVPGLNKISMSVKDQSGKEGKIERTVSLSDLSGPTYQFTPTSWSIFDLTAEQKFEIHLKDVSEIDESSIQVSLNGGTVPSTSFYWDEVERKLKVVLNSSPRFIPGPNFIKVKASDINGRMSEGSVVYKLADQKAPSVTFEPAPGSQFENDISPGIKISVVDDSPINFETASFFVNGVKIDPSNVAIDTENGHALLSLTQNKFKIGQNQISAVVYDANQNSSSVSATYEVLDTLAPSLNPSPGTGTVFTSLKQAISLQFEDMSDLNWSTLILEMNGNLIPPTAISRAGNLVSVNLGQEVNLEQGDNTLAVKLTDLRGNSLVSEINYVLDDIFPAEFEFIPTADTLSSLSPDVRIKISDRGTLRWTTLALKLNGEALPEDQFAVISGEIILNLTGNYRMHKGLNFIDVSIRDEKDNLGSASKGYLVLPSTADLVLPTVSFDVPSGKYSTAPSKVVMTVSDSNGIDFNRIKIWMNGTLLPDTILVKDRIGSKVEILLLDNVSLAAGKNYLKAYVTDNMNNVGGKAAVYEITADINQDIFAPIITFSPGGGQLVGNTPTVQAYLSDASGINYSTFQALLNDSPIPSSALAIDEVNGKVFINFSSSYPLPAEGASTITIKVEDSKGNLAVAKVGFDRLDQTTLQINTYAVASTSGRTSCAIIDGGNLHCWGGNNFGALGLGNLLSIGRTEYPGDVPFISVGEPVTSVVTGFHTCVITNTGKMRCWGNNDSGQLGLGHKNNIGDNELPTTQPFIDLGGEKVVQIAIGVLHTCAILESGSLKCWGANVYGEGGRATSDLYGDDEVPSQIPNVDLGAKALQVACSQRNTCVLLETGKVKCFGLGQSGANGNASPASTLGQIPSQLSDIQLSGLVKEISVNASGTHFCALLQNGDVNCWGLNADGQLGYGTKQIIGDNETPASKGVVSLGASATKLATGPNHTCALLATGEVRCWGSGAFTQNGYTFTVGDDELPTSQPVLNYGSGVVKDITVGSNFTCLIFDNATMKC